MRKRNRIILIHVLESLGLAVLAGFIVAATDPIWIVVSRPCADRLAAFGNVGLPLLIVFPLMFAGLIAPRMFVSVIKSLRRFPIHFGLLVKTAVGVVVYVLVGWLFFGRYPRMDVYAWTVLGGSVLLGFGLGYLLARLAESTNRYRQPKKNCAGGAQEKGLESWFSDDLPIDTIGENRVPEHAGTARRILSKLGSEAEKDRGVLPNLALSGPYGSGKTSICNLVRDTYEREKKRSNLPRMIFCRFEAWQFLTAEAAVRNLMEVATSKILELGDFPELWGIPDKYIEAVKATGNRWARVCAALFAGCRSPHETAASIGDILQRLDMRLVIFVDDFDRIEGDVSATQQAVAKALNQLQSIPNIQFVICVGPVLDAPGRSSGTRPSGDLLKLTRFQEPIPEVRLSNVVHLVKELRERATSDNSYYFLWAEKKEDETDPLTYHPQFESLYSSIGLTGNLAGLIRTPRALKSVLRETDKSWEGGLKGEIDWYDLVILSALKAAEPELFEWILREPDTFIEEPRRAPTDPERMAGENHAKDLKRRLSECIQSKGSTDREGVIDAVSRLFPAFLAKTEGPGRGWMNKPLEWSQKIASVPKHGRTYLERFFAGVVPEDDIPDQPTIRYIRKIMRGNFDGKEFESLYLDSHEKLTGLLNKFVQFAGLLSRNVAYQVCDNMLAWLAKPESANLWPEPERFVMDVMPDVISIITLSGTPDKDVLAITQQQPQEKDWFGEKIEQYGGNAPFVAIDLTEYAIKDGLANQEHVNRLCMCLRREFVVGGRTFLPMLLFCRYSLGWFLESLKKCADYGSFRTQLTEKLISEADKDTSGELRERIILSLVGVSWPAGSRNPPIESYTISVDKQKNEQTYDMGLLLPVLKKWRSVRCTDQVAEAALSYLVMA